MMPVHEVSRISGVSIRTLHYYDSIGLLKPSAVTDAGYRLYDEAALERLQSILLFRELEFPLRQIGRILDSPGYDRSEVLTRQIHMLELRRDRLSRLIGLACKIKENGGNTMDFQAFDTNKLDEYARQAKEAWGATPQYQCFTEKDKNRTPADRKALAGEMELIFAGFGALRHLSPESPEAAEKVKELQRFITGHFYPCTDEILCSLGDMYAAGGEFTQNIDKAGGEGTAVFACRAIHACMDAKK